MFQGLTFVALFLLFGLSGNIAHGETQPQPLPTASRGELLYSTHCIACHSTQIHWREKNWLVTGKACFRKYSAGKKP